MSPISQSLSILILSLPDKRIFDLPMSKKARILLEKVLVWGNTKSGKCYKGSSKPSVDCIQAFASEYIPIIFEKAVHKYNADDVSKAITGYSPKTAQALLDLMLLKPLSDPTWIAQHNISNNIHRVGTLESDKAIQIYEWLTSRFLIVDFTEHDLNKISEMSQEEYSLENIKSIAQEILDIDKKTMAYLYAIVKNDLARNSHDRQTRASMDVRHEQRLAQLIQPQPPKITHVIQDKKEDWERAREWIDFARQLRKDTDGS